MEQRNLPILIAIVFCVIILLIIPSIPFTNSQFIAQSTDLNYILFSSGFYNGKILSIDNNILTAIDINGGGSGGGIDTNWQTSWVTFDANMKAQYRKYSVDLNTSANVNADENVSATYFKGNGSLLTGLSGGSQTPWLSDINANNFSLLGANYITTNHLAGASGLNYLGLIIDSKNNYNGIAQNQATSTIGKFGNAIKLNGTTQHVSAPDTGLPFGSTNRSVSLWFKSVGTQTGNYSTPLSYGKYDYGNYFAFLITNVTGKITINNGGQSPISPHASILDGNWHLIVGTVNGNVWKQYIDGVYDSNMTAIVSDTISDQALEIGTGYNGIGNFHFSGLIDDVGIWNNRVLSASDVTALWNGGTGNLLSTSDTNIIRVYHFEDANTGNLSLIGNIDFNNAIISTMTVNNITANNFTGGAFNGDVYSNNLYGQGDACKYITYDDSGNTYIGDIDECYDGGYVTIDSTGKLTAPNGVDPPYFSLTPTRQKDLISIINKGLPISHVGELVLFYDAGKLKALRIDSLKSGTVFNIPMIQESVVALDLNKPVSIFIATTRSTQPPKTPK